MQTAAGTTGKQWCRVGQRLHHRARFAGHNYIGTEHILLGLLREGEGVAARVLETLGADPAKIRTQVKPRQRRAPSPK